MPDKVEDILKQIHVLFAKSDRYNNDPDKVVIDRQDMFELLEDLNEALYEVLEQYEATTRSRERARLEMDRQAAEVAAQAQQKSDDIHASSLLYLDSMLSEAKGIMEEARKRVKHELIEMLAQIEKSEESIDTNRDGLKQELSQMHGSGVYLEALEDLRKKNEKKKPGDYEEDEEQVFEQPKPAEVVIRVNRPGENTGVTFTTKHGRKKNAKNASASDSTATANTATDELPTPMGSVFSASDFDLDAEFEQWKAEQEGTDIPAEPVKQKSRFASLFGKKQ